MKKYNSYDIFYWSERKWKKKGINAAQTELEHWREWNKISQIFFLFAFYGKNKTVTLTEIIFFIKDKNVTYFIFFFSYTFYN